MDFRLLRIVPPFHHTAHAQPGPSAPPDREPTERRDLGPGPSHSGSTVPSCFRSNFPGGTCPSYQRTVFVPLAGPRNEGAELSRDTVNVSAPIVTWNGPSPSMSLR